MLELKVVTLASSTIAQVIYLRFLSCVARNLSTCQVMNVNLQSHYLSCF